MERKKRGEKTKRQLGKDWGRAEQWCEKEKEEEKEEGRGRR